MHNVGVPPDIARDIKLFRYRQAFGLSYADAINEPNEEIERAFVIWSLDAQRDKLKAKLHKH